MLIFRSFPHPISKNKKIDPFLVDCTDSDCDVSDGGMEDSLLQMLFGVDKWFFFIWGCPLPRGP
jgi:hypothetical protein